MEASRAAKVKNDPLDIETRGTKVNQNVEVENEPRNDKAEIDEVEHPTPSANDSQYQKNINKAHQSLPEEFKKDPTRDPNN